MRVKALLTKDIYVLIRQMRLFCLMIFVFTLLPNFYLQLFGVVYSGLFSFSTISQDEQSHWDVLAGMMPYSVRDLVVSKYLLGWGGVLIAGTLAVLGGMVQRGFLPEAARPEGVLIELCIALFRIAISLPFLFRFGSTRGRQIMMMVLIVVACGSAGGLAALMQTGLLDRLPGGMMVLLPLLAVAANAVSVPVAMAMYRRRYEG